MQVSRVDHEQQTNQTDNRHSPYRDAFDTPFDDGLRGTSNPVQAALTISRNNAARPLRKEIGREGKKSVSLYFNVELPGRICHLYREFPTVSIRRTGSGPHSHLARGVHTVRWTLPPRLSRRLDKVAISNPDAPHVA